MPKKATRAKAESESLVITVSGDRPIKDVARDLRAAGFKVGQVLETVGVVTGSAHAGSADRLRRVKGVTDVSADHPVSIGPPGSPVS
jgi:hypothetical protein